MKMNLNSAVGIATKSHKRHKTNAMSRVATGTRLHPTGEGFQRLKARRRFRVCAPCVLFCGRSIAVIRMNLSMAFRAWVLAGALATGLFGVLPAARSCPPPPPPSVVTITASDANASEIGPDPGAFTVTRLGGNQSVALTVYYTIGGTAQNGTDYQTLPGYVTIAPYASAATVTVTPILDANSGEGNETVVLTLAPYANYTVGSPNSATVTIKDASVVTIAATDANASEVGPDTGTYRVTRTGGNQSGALVVYYTIGGTAQNGSDYQTLPGYVTIAANASTADVTLTPIPDSNGSEGDETAVLTLATDGNYYVGTPDSATVTIAEPMDSDGDGLPDDVDAEPYVYDTSLPTFTITSPTEGASF